MLKAMHAQEDRKAAAEGFYLMDLGKKVPTFISVGLHYPCWLMKVEYVLDVTGTVTRLQGRSCPRGAARAAPFFPVAIERRRPR